MFNNELCYYLGFSAKVLVTHFKVALFSWWVLLYLSFHLNSCILVTKFYHLASHVYLMRVKGLQFVIKALSFWTLQNEWVSWCWAQSPRLWAWSIWCRQQCCICKLLPAWWDCHIRSYQNYVVNISIIWKVFHFNTVCGTCLLVGFVWWPNLSSSM